MSYDRTQVEKRVDERTKELDLKMYEVLQERELMQAIKLANYWDEPLRTDALKTLFQTYKLSYE